MKKIVAFSDTHGQHNSKVLTECLMKNPADILLFAGDMQRNNLDFCESFAAWMLALPFKYKIITFGNHDSNAEYMLDLLDADSNLVVLNNEDVIIDGIKIYGSPNSVIFGNWHYMNTEPELAEIYKNIPDDTDILLTHSPAKGILDKTFTSCEAGSEALANRISGLAKMKYHVFGHIHEAFGYSNQNSYVALNVSILDERYALKHLPTVFTI